MVADTIEPAAAGPYTPVNWDDHQRRMVEIRERQEANRLESLRLLDPDYAARVAASKPLYEFTVECEYPSKTSSGRVETATKKSRVIAQSEHHAWSLFLHDNGLNLGPRDCVRTIKQGKKTN